MTAARSNSGDTGPAVKGQLDKATSALLHGRQTFKRGEESSEIYSAYMFALKALDHALAIDPENTRAQRERITVAQELAAILRDNDQGEQADLILRLNGLEDAPVARVQLPEDPFLVIEEAERVSIRRAFGGTVRFEPTDKSFSRLRAWVKGQGKRFS